MIIGNRDDSPIGFSSPDLTLPPTASIGLTDRESIRTAIAGGDPVSVTIKDASGAREDSYRWLIGEKSEAFGGAIRDMWNPTCYGDPGKVSDAEYKCATDDNGGVHGNSGVVNHATPCWSTAAPTTVTPSRASASTRPRPSTTRR